MKAKKFKKSAEYAGDGRDQEFKDAVTNSLNGKKESKKAAKAAKKLEKQHKKAVKHAYPLSAAEMGKEDQKKWKNYLRLLEDIATASETLTAILADSLLLSKPVLRGIRKLQQLHKKLNDAPYIKI